MEGDQSWSGEVELPIPLRLPPGDYVLTLRWGDETEHVELEVLPSVAELRRSIERSAPRPSS